MVIYKIKKSCGGRLSEMGLINGSIIRIVKQLFGMCYIRLNDSYLVMGDDVFNTIDKEVIT